MENPSGGISELRKWLLGWVKLFQAREGVGEACRMKCFGGGKISSPNGIGLVELVEGSTDIHSCNNLSRAQGIRWRKIVRYIMCLKFFPQKVMFPERQV